MELDDSIIQLGAKLDEWCEGSLATIASMDRVAQGRALFAGIEILKELDRLKEMGLVAITALLNRRDAVTEDERAASLIQGFKFAAKLRATLHDELLDTDSENKVVDLMIAIATALDAIGPGRSALAVLLDNADAGVRASAGAYLVKVMPERVVPILREIDERGDGRSASFTAYWALLRWECEGKARSNG